MHFLLTWIVFPFEPKPIQKTDNKYLISSKMPQMLCKNYLLITDTPHNLLQKSTPVYTDSATTRENVKQPSAVTVIRKLYLLRDNQNKNSKQIILITIILNTALWYLKIMKKCSCHELMTCLGQHSHSWTGNNSFLLRNYNNVLAKRKKLQYWQQIALFFY